MMGCQRTVLSTDLDYAFGDDILTPMGDACLGSLRLLTEGIATLVVHREAMAAKAGAFWSTTSHLADELVRRYDLSFRDAHQIVGRFVRDAIAAGQTPQPWTQRSTCTRGAGFQALKIDCSAATEVQQALDATNFLPRARDRGQRQPATCASTSRRSPARRRARAGTATRPGAGESLAALDARARELASDLDVSAIAVHLIPKPEDAGGRYGQDEFGYRREAYPDKNGSEARVSKKRAKDLFVRAAELQAGRGQVFVITRRCRKPRPRLMRTHDALRVSERPPDLRLPPCSLPPPPQEN